jgi:hypothetical protein
MPTTEATVRWSDERSEIMSHSFKRREEEGGGEVTDQHPSMLTLEIVSDMSLELDYSCSIAIHFLSSVTNSTYISQELLRHYEKRRCREEEEEGGEGRRVWLTKTRSLAAVILAIFLFLQPTKIQI